VEETSKEGICLVIAERFLLHPVSVLLGKPEKVVAMQVYAGANAMPE
jgi:hypothetical protein